MLKWIKLDNFETVITSPTDSAVHHGSYVHYLNKKMRFGIYQYSKGSMVVGLLSPSEKTITEAQKYPFIKRTHDGLSIDETYDLNLVSQFIQFIDDWEGIQEIKSEVLSYLFNPDMQELQSCLKLLKEGRELEAFDRAIKFCRTPNNLILFVTEYLYEKYNYSGKEFGSGITLETLYGCIEPPHYRRANARLLALFEEKHKNDLDSYDNLQTRYRLAAEADILQKDQLFHQLCGKEGKATILNVNSIESQLKIALEIKQLREELVKLKANKKEQQEDTDNNNIKPKFSPSLF